jgi:hypothetical protein
LRKIVTIAAVMAYDCESAAGGGADANAPVSPLDVRMVGMPWKPSPNGRLTDSAKLAGAAGTRVILSLACPELVEGCVFTRLFFLSRRTFLQTMRNERRS